MKARRIFALLLTLLLTFSILPISSDSVVPSVSAYFYSEDVEKYSKVVGDWRLMIDVDDEYWYGYYIMEYFGDDKDIVIPSEVEGHLIRGIGGRTFQNTDITSVYIPNTIEFIWDGAFYNCANLSKVTFQEDSKLKNLSGFEKCTSLESITIPSSVTDIDREAFKYCENLSEIIFEENSNLTWISGFEGCSSLKTMMLPKTVKYITTNAFKNCSSLEQIQIPSNAVSIGAHAFSGCQKLSMPNLSNIQEIGNYAFLGCKLFENIKFNKIRKIYSYAFEGCENLKSVSLSKTTLYVYKSVFYNCPSLKKISVDKNCKRYTTYDGALLNKSKTIIIAYPAARADKSFKIPNTVKAIKKHSFFGAKDLKINLVIPKSVRTIGNYAFARCSGIKKITMPNKVNYVGKKAFKNTACMKAQSKNKVYYADNVLVRITNLGKNYTLKKTTTHIASFALEGANVKTLTIPKSVVSFSENALSGKSNINTLVINSSVTKLTDIGLPKTYYQKQTTYLGVEHTPVPVKESTIKNIVLNSRVTSIGNTFKETTIESIKLPDTLKKIDAYAFSKCRNLKKITLPKNVKVFDTGAFATAGFEEFVIPKTVTTLGKRVFMNSKLTSIIVPDTVKKIGSHLFMGSSNLQGAKLPSHIKTIPGYIFSYCKSFKDFTISKNVTKIGAKAFAYSGIEQMVIPDTVVNLGDNGMFKGCKSLEYVKLPENDTITHLPAQFFRKSSIKQVVIPENYTSLGNYVFESSDIEQLQLSKNITALPKGAFANCKNLKYLELPEALEKTEADFTDTPFTDSGIQEVVVYEGVKDFYNTFKGCTKLTKATFKGDVGCLSGTFYGCTSLETVVFEQSVDEFASGAFHGCTALNKITIGVGAVNNINNIAFKEANSEVEFYVSTQDDASNLKGKLDALGLSEAKIYANGVIVYKSVG